MIFRISRHNEVTSYPDMAAAQRAGNSPAYAEPDELACDTTVGITRLNNLIEKFSGKPSEIGDRSAAAKALWPLLGANAKPGKVVGGKADEPSPAKPATPAKPAKKKRAAGGGANGNRSKTIHPTVKDNPYREGSKSHHAFEMILKSPGKTFQHYVDAGARINTINHAIREGHVELKSAG